MYKNFLKPLFDFTVALSALLILSPVLVLTAVALAVVNKGNPFFLQRRPGKDERIFKIIKFKTMNDERDREGKLLPDSERLTRVGRTVRKFSIDEIPQLVNVLKGDMSLIGPRPLLPDYLPLYNEFQKKRHKVKPGMTGLAAVNGRNSLNWDKKFSLDVEYVENLGPGLDLEILIKTIQKVVLSEGVSAEGHSTMPRYSEYLKQKKNL